MVDSFTPIRASIVEIVMRVYAIVRNLAPTILGILLFCALPVVAIGQDHNGIEVKYLDSKRVISRSEGLREPSGLALAAGGNHFWTVSDNSSRIFRVDQEGRLDPSGTIKIRLSGPEGITEDIARNRLIVTSENNSEIVEINLKTGITKRFALRGINGFASNGLFFSRWGLNNGLEGVTVDPATGAVFVLKEKSPRLMLELSPDLSMVRASHPLTAEMGFVDGRVRDESLDVSGIAYDPRRRAFWIVSDTAKRLFLFDPLAEKANSWPLTAGDGRRLRNAEGIALSEDGQVIYIVTDDHRGSRLVSYEIVQH